MTLQEEKELVARAASKFPSKFGLKLFPGKTFTIKKEASYVNSEGVAMLYVYVITDGEPLNFAKGTEEELQREIVKL